MIAFEREKSAGLRDPNEGTVFGNPKRVGFARAETWTQ